MNWLIVDEIIKNALKEDIPSEDITTIPIVTEDSLCSVNLISKEDGILAGAEVFENGVLIIYRRSSLPVRSCCL